MRPRDRSNRWLGIATAAR
jgi:hypothetical protein